jgi:hypothetical protein
MAISRNTPMRRLAKIDAVMIREAIPTFLYMEDAMEFGNTPAQGKQ